MRLRVRNHVNPLGAGFAQLRDQGPVLPSDREIELEIGCADAQFLFQRAAADPSRFYVGLEIREELVQDVNQRARVEGLPVHAVFCNANLHIEQLFAESSIDRVFVNFPDPWFKRRHQKRRMVDEQLARQACRVLRPGGELFVQTDVWQVALDALSAFEDRLTNQAGSWSFWRQGNPYRVESLREQRCELSGTPIWRFVLPIGR